MTQIISTELKTQVKENYDMVCKSLQEVETIQDRNYKTSCQFRYNPTNAYSQVEIDETSSIKSLIDVWAFIRTKEQNYQDAADDLKLKNFPLFKWCGYKSEDWKHDIQLRVAILTQNEKVEKLKKWKTKLSDFLSEDDKLNSMLSEMKDDLPF